MGKSFLPGSVRGGVAALPEVFLRFLNFLFIQYLWARIVAALATELSVETSRVIHRWVDTASWERSAWWSAEDNHVVQNEHGVSQVDLAIVICVTRVVTCSHVSLELDCKNGRSVCNIDTLVEVTVGANELTLSNNADVAAVRRNCTFGDGLVYDNSVVNRDRTTTVSTVAEANFVALVTSSVRTNVDVDATDS